MHNEIHINYICPVCLYHEQLHLQITGKSSLKFNPGITTRAACTQCGTIMYHCDEGLFNVIQMLLEKKYFIYEHCSQLDGVIYHCDECESDPTITGPFITFGPVYRKERDLFNRIMEDSTKWITRKTLDAMFDETGEHVAIGYAFGDGNVISLITRIDKESDQKTQLHELGCAAITDIIKAFTDVIDANNPKRRSSTSTNDRLSMGFQHRYIQSKRYFDADMQRAYEADM